jgi:DNA invertase Pin-like site-specific DNA recombinase
MSLKTKPAKRLIGYARVSTQQQDLARQTKALKRLGCAVIYSDTASGKSMAGRPQLARALDALDTGDELVIAEWDRATRSMWDGLQIIKAVIDAGAAIKVLDRSYIDLTTPMGRGFMAKPITRWNMLCAKFEPRGSSLRLVCRSQRPSCGRPE